MGKPVQNQRGQVGLIVLLISSVLLTVGVSVASRGVSELKLSRQEEESSRAFEVAEIGIEEALQREIETLPFENGVYSEEVELDELGEGGDRVGATYTVEEVNEWELRLERGEAGEVNVAGPANGVVTIHWPESTVCANEAALLVTIYKNDYSIRRYGYGSAKCNYERNNLNFDSATLTGTQMKTNIPIAADDEMIRIKPLFADAVVRVEPGSGWNSTGGFPVQYYKVTAQATNTVGRETRAIQVRRSILSAPSIFDYALFSGTQIIK